MNQPFAAAIIPLAAACAAQAHFVFVVPEAGGASAKVILSETLQPDSRVDAGLIGGVRLSLRDAASRETPLALTRAGDAFTTPLPGSGTRLVHGLADLGVIKRGKPHLLLYYPKTIVGDAFDPPARVGETAAVEIVPLGRPDGFALQLLVRGKPKAGGEITLVLPDGTGKIVKTGEDGRTGNFTQTGRYGAWARYWELGAGERSGEKYEQVRHYATLVFDAGVPASPAASAAVLRFATLPQAVSSFGAATCGGWLYVYGGHISPTHDYSRRAVSGRFGRMRLTSEPVWEELPGGPALQGLNLAAHDGRIYRVGGMAPRNEPGQPADNRSVADAARFDPRAKQWETLPPLPEPRSSHDVVVVGGRLIVVGGWTLAGRSQRWLDTFLVMDLAAKKPQWRSFPQPFKRRALMAAAHDGKMYVIGGFSERNTMVRNVSIYDPESQTWSEGPELPDHPPAGAFAPAAGVHQGRLYVSVADGTLFRLAESGAAWETAGSGTPRVAHRMAFLDEAVLVIGGAANGRNFDLIEALPLSAGN